MMIDIRPVERADDLRQFIRLPRQLYCHCPGFVPPLDFERSKLLHPSHGSFFKNGTARYWIAWRDDRPVGRISAQLDQNSPNGGGAGIGSFGCLDAIDDTGVVSALLDTAALWLRAADMSKMRGPFTLSINGESGLQIDGQGERPMTWMPWHPGYLAPHVVAAGFIPVKDLLAYSLRHEPPQIEIPARLLQNLTVRELTVKQLERDADIIREIFNSSWKNNWGFVPLTSADTTSLCRSFRPFLHKKCGLFVEKHGKPLGFGLFVPNLFDITRDLDGRLFPTNWMRFLWRVMRPGYRSVRAVLTGVHGDIQHTLLGGVVSVLLVNAAFRSWHHWPHPIEEVEMGWVLDDNHRMRSLLESRGCVVTKRYRLYERML
jgi:hypothetical protein